MTANRATVRTTPGLGFVGALTLLFIALKLLGIITWPWIWIWVLAPLWLSFTLTVVLLLIIGAVALVFAALKDRRR